MARSEQATPAARAVRIILVGAVVAVVVALLGVIVLVRVGQGVQSARDASDQASIAATEARTASEANGRVLEEIERVAAYLIECTTPGPQRPTAQDPTTGHPCFDAGLARSGQAIADLRRSIGCAALYVLGEEPPGCADVDERVEILRRGGQL